MAKAKVEQPDLLGEDMLGMPPPALKDAFDAWNEHAKAVPNWPTVKTLDEGRRTKLKKALRTCGGQVGWRAMLTDATKSDVLTGRASWAKGSKWFNFDWLIKPANLVKVLDGNYENAEAEPLSFAQQMKGVGTKTRYAEPPKEIFKHDIESPEDRMAFTIERYRAAGKWADANRVEEKLAALQKRPAVLVPAPEVAHLTGSEAQSPRARPPMSQKSPADEERARREAFEKKRQSGTASDLPGWVDEAIPDSAYGDA